MGPHWTLIEAFIKLGSIFILWHISNSSNWILDEGSHEELRVLAMKQIFALVSSFVDRGPSFSNRVS
jgi:hypothetical protein